MNTKTHRVGESFEFALPDAGSGGETRTSTEMADSHDFVVAVLLRDHYCPLSRQIVQSLAEAFETFAGRSAAVVPVLPDCRERASVWQRRYDLPFGLLTDPAEGEAPAVFEQFEPFERLLPELPGAVVFEADGETLRFVETVRIERTEDGPGIGTVLERIDDHADDAVVDPVGLTPDVETVGDS